MSHIDITLKHMRTAVQGSHEQGSMKMRHLQDKQQGKHKGKYTNPTGQSLRMNVYNKRWQANTETPMMRISWMTSKISYPCKTLGHPQESLLLIPPIHIFSSISSFLLPQPVRANCRTRHSWMLKSKCSQCTKGNNLKRCEAFIYLFYHAIILFHVNKKYINCIHKQ